MDKAVDGCTRAHVRNRLELARAKMNHLHTFLLGFSEEARLLIVSKAYSNANSNRENVIQERDMLSAHKQIDIETHEQQVFN